MIPMFNPKHKKYVKLAIAILITVLGCAFILIPFIPLGFVFLTGGLMLLIQHMPVFDRQFDQIRRSSKNNLLVGVERKVQEVEERLIRFLIREPAIKRGPCIRP